MRISLNLTEEERIAHRNELARKKYHRDKRKRVVKGYHEILELAFQEFSKKVEEGIRTAEKNRDEMVDVKFDNTIHKLAETLADDERFHLVYKEKNGK